MKMLRILFIIILLTSLLGCGYTSIYEQNKNNNFSITSLEFTGDKTINNTLNRKLNKYTKNKSDKNFKIIINSKYSKTPIAKDQTGTATDFKLVVDLDLEFLIQNKSNKISMTETFNIKNDSDNFQQSKYEKEIKNNLSNFLFDKIISYLSSFE